MGAARRADETVSAAAKLWAGEQGEGGVLEASRMQGSKAWGPGQGNRDVL